MEISTLLVPVVGGYIALFITNATRYYIVRQTGYPQFFFSVLAGAILLFLSRLITNSFSEDYPQIECWWSQMAPMAYSGTLAITLVLGIVAPLITNVVVGWFIDKDALVIAAANRHGNMFDSILESALGTNSFVQLNTQGRKVYIGIPQRVTAPLGNSTEITIMPFVSGFLDSKKNHLELVTDYWPVYEKCIEQEEDLLHLRPEDFIVAIPRNQIVLVRRFDFTAYGSFPAKSAK